VLKASKEETDCDLDRRVERWISRSGDEVGASGEEDGDLNEEDEAEGEKYDPAGVWYIVNVVCVVVIVPYWNLEDLEREDVDVREG
jgi:hypothetical protein